MFTNGGGPFPSQVVSDAEKASLEYGQQVAQAIEYEWFSQGRANGNRYLTTWNNYNRLRLYARGEQSIRKYKDEFAINGDLSYLNLDWKPVPIIPKFVDIIVNGMQDRLFTIKAFAQDPIATGKRTKFVENIQRDLHAKELLAEIETELGVNARNIPEEKLPANTEELELFMQLNYKQGIEIAEEQAINNILLTNKYPELKTRVDYDLTVLGIGAVKNTFNNTDGIKLEYVDPANLIWSYTEDPNFQDCYYFGEVKRIQLNELKKQFPDLSNEEIKELTKKGSNWTDYNTIGTFSNKSALDNNNTVTLLYFNWKTWEHNVYKIKETSTGASKAIEKDDSFNPPKDKRTRFERVAQSREVLYEGAFVLGTNTLLKWEKAENMVRPHSNTNKVYMNYTVSAPRMYKGNIVSLVSKITPYADLIQLTHLKLQQAIQRMTPSGVYLDADGLAEIDLGNGTSYNPQEALNMYFQTGSIIGRSLTVEGDQNPGKVPIQELPGGGGNQIQVLIATYNQYIQMIRDVTGLNEARDGSDPDPKSLVGVQKLAAANSNVATRHILQASMAITVTLAECIALRFKDVLEFHPTKEAFIGSLGMFSVGSLEELKNLNLHDFGIFLELAPDEEQKQILENNIQMALQQQAINLEDAIDSREIKNLKLANQLLKVRRRKKIEQDQATSQQNIKAQADANTQTTQAAAESEVQKQSALNQQKAELIQMEAELEVNKMKEEKELKKELMLYEFRLAKEMQQVQNDGLQNKEKYKEDRKDERTKIQASQQSELIEQRAGKQGKKTFESAGNDTMGSGFNMEMFEPR